MLWLFRALTDRLKVMFAADVATDFEAQLLTRDAERRAELLRRAQRYDDEGYAGIAQHIRRQAERLDIQQPLASILPAIEHLQAHDAQPAPLLIATERTTLPTVAAPQNTNVKKKGR